MIDTNKQKLEEQLKDLKKQLESIEAQDPYNRESYADENTQDDDASEREEHDRVEAIRNSLQEKIKKVEDAIDRIHDLSYGICSECGKPIDQARLKVLPETDLCITCGRKSDSNH